MSRRTPSKACNSKKIVNRAIRRSCKLRNRTPDMDEIREKVDLQIDTPVDNPEHTRCIECNRVMEKVTMEKHLASRGHKKRLRDLREDALLEQDRKNGLF
ncbi:bud site selection protein 2 [Nematocida displodere]|uniref:Bud site selection protein 2 n=1 Tax=Nematocida displodere TaxID=1805483 RepID=A0A177EI87_9MICR|nr:bud site selection protein 2 [Nematocida displodere]